MSRLRRAIVTMALALIALLALGLVIFGISFVGFVWGLPVLMGAVLLYGWVYYTFVRYRQARQEELLHVVATSASAGLPLPPALRAYLHDRPRNFVYRFSVGTVLHVFVLPFYYFIWHRGRSFDDRITRLAERLEAGESLSAALTADPALASIDARIAAVVGEESGDLPGCLRRAERERFAAAWLELLPRLVYPFVLLGFVAAATAFLVIVVLPRIRRIYSDVKLELPAATNALIDAFDWCVDNSMTVFAVIAGVVVLIVLPLVSTTFRWFMPVVGRFYRAELQGITLRGLSALLASERTAPRALALLAGNDNLPWIVRRKLNRAALAINRGEPLPATLHAVGLLPAAMTPLVATSERVRSLPVALRELGDLLAVRAIRLARKLSLVLAPVALVAVGVVVAGVCLAIFIPLIRLIEHETY